MKAAWRVIVCLVLSLGLVPVLYAEEGDAVEGEEGAPARPSVEYVALEPDIVTNYGVEGRLHFVRVKASIKATADAVASVHDHMPFIRDTLLMALAGQTPENVHSVDAQAAVRASVLEQINNFLIEEGEPAIEEVLFTEFLAQ